MVIENGIVQNINGHGSGQLAQPVPDPIFAIAEVFARERIESEQTAPADKSVPAVIDTDLIRNEGFGSRFGRHVRAPGSSQDTERLYT